MDTNLTSFARTDIRTIS